MYRLNEILENKIINNLIAGFEKSPYKINKPHESDAEILQLGNLKLAITTDSISEEISTGLYSDPYLIGWMIVTVNISDLAAVGAKPIGILISEIIPKDFNDENVKLLQKGISDACKEYNTHVLGGDTNEGKSFVLTGTAIGTIDNEMILSRVGCNVDDILYSTGKLGNGNAFAISKLIVNTSLSINYKPAARIELRNLISKYASACMDTSDGLISTLDQLMRLNSVGFKINRNTDTLIDDEALDYINKLNLPTWLLLAGQHGEFELVFTIPQKLNQDFLKEANKNSFEPIELGEVIADKEIGINPYGKSIPINSEFIRNLPQKTDGDVNHYLKLLLKYDLELR